MFTSRFFRLLLSVSLVGGLLAASALGAGAGSRPAAGRTHVQTAQSGNLSASFSFRERSYRFGAEELTIRDGGQVVYQGPVKAPQCGNRCAPEGIGRGSNPLAFVTLTPGAAPSLVLSLYSNYLHCCFIAQVFTPSGTASGGVGSGAWTVSSYNFGDPGFSLADLGHTGAEEFVSADDRFAYAFTDFAASGLPVMVLSYTDGQFQNVTRDYPSVIARDAHAWLKYFRQQRRYAYDDSNGLIAAWAADEEELGASASVNRFLAEQARAGHLNAALGTVVPQGFKFVRALRRFLVKTGYVSG